MTSCRSPSDLGKEAFRVFADHVLSALVEQDNVDRKLIHVDTLISDLSTSRTDWQARLTVKGMKMCSTATPLVKKAVWKNGT